MTDEERIKIVEIISELVEAISGCLKYSLTNSEILYNLGEGDFDKVNDAMKRSEKIHQDVSNHLEISLNKVSEIP